MDWGHVQFRLSLQQLVKACIAVYFVSCEQCWLAVPCNRCSFGPRKAARDEGRTTLLHPQRRLIFSGVHFWRNLAPSHPQEELAHHCEGRDEVLGCLIGLVTHRSLQLPLASVLLPRKFLIVPPMPPRRDCYFDFTPV